ncbi:MAG: hypothetical protein ACOYK8_04370 [Alphaproteobacteria bacterium]
MFKSRIFNQCILIKDVVHDKFKTARVRGEKFNIATKVYLPFDWRNIHNGGNVLIYGTAHFDAALADLIDLKVPEYRAAWEYDRKVLDVFDSLPSFAPFLVRDKLQMEALEPDERYFLISEDEWANIETFIHGRFGKIVGALFPGSEADSHEKLKFLIMLLWDLQDIPALRNIAGMFKLPQDKAKEIFYAWKGIIFFEYEYSRNIEAIMACQDWFTSNAKPRNFLQKRELDKIDAEAQNVVQLIREPMSVMANRLSEYNDAFDDLFRFKRGPQRFTQFLLMAPEHFWNMGYALGRLTQAVEIWDTKTKINSTRSLNSDALMELLSIINDVLA